jgi:hypothetical protein
MSVRQIVKTLQWKEETPLWVIHNRVGQWISTPPHFIAPAYYAAELHMRDMRGMHSELDLTKPGLYTLSSRAVYRVNNSKPDITAAVTYPFPSGQFLEWDEVKEIEASERMGRIRLLPADRQAYLAPFTLIVAKNGKNFRVFVSVFRQRVIFVRDNKIIGIIGLIPLEKYLSCDICKEDADYQIHARGFSASACPVHHADIRKVLDARIFLSTLGMRDELSSDYSELRNYTLSEVAESSWKKDGPTL